MKVTKKMNYITNDKDFFNGLKDLAIDISNKHSLDANAILGKSDKISYMFMTEGLLEYEKGTRLTTFLGNNKKYLNCDGYIQFNKSVKNPDVCATY